MLSLEYASVQGRYPLLLGARSEGLRLMHVAFVLVLCLTPTNISLFAGRLLPCPPESGEREDSRLKDYCGGEAKTIHGKLIAN